MRWTSILLKIIMSPMTLTLPIANRPVETSPSLSALAHHHDTFWTNSQAVQKIYNKRDSHLWAFETCDLDLEDSNLFFFAGRSIYQWRTSMPILIATVQQFSRYVMDTVSSGFEPCDLDLDDTEQPKLSTSQYVWLAIHQHIYLGRILCTIVKKRYGGVIVEDSNPVTITLMLKIANHLCNSLTCGFLSVQLGVDLP